MLSRISLAKVARSPVVGGVETRHGSVLKFPEPSIDENLHVPDSLDSFRDLSLPELDLEFDPHYGALWCLKRHTLRPNFTQALIDNIKAVQKCTREAFLSAGPEGMPIKYMIWASKKKNIFNLGGDLIHFVELLNERDRAGLESYARACVDICFANYTNLDLPILTIALVQGDALGGGLESALSNDIIIAERSAQFGFPEILFGLFPGMGAYSFVARRAGSKAADDLIFSGRILRAEQLYDLGLIDILAPDGDGEKELDTYLRRNKTKFNAHQALFETRRRINPVSSQEMYRIAERWVDVAMDLTERDIKKMRRLANAQMKRVEKIQQETAELEASRSLDPTVNSGDWTVAAKTVKDSLLGKEASSIVNFDFSPGSDARKLSPTNPKNLSNEKFGESDNDVSYTGESENSTGESKSSERTAQLSSQDNVRPSPDKSEAEEPEPKTVKPRVRSMKPAGLRGDDTIIYTRFMEEVAEARAAATLQPGVERMLSEGLSREDYLRFLEQLYHVVWHFCPTMATAAARCGDENRELRYALYESIADEKGHEMWVLEDIAAIGGDPEAVKISTPEVPVRAMIGHNYYMAGNQNPWSVMGMVHVLEEISANYSSRVAAMVAKRLGITDGQGFHFLGSHGSLDEEHAGEFKKFIQHACLDADLKAITDSAKVNYALFGALFKDE